MRYVFNALSNNLDVVYTGAGTGIGDPILSSTNNIDAKTVANTPLYTVPMGNCVITGAIVRCTSATAITNGPTLGIGNAAGTNNIFASTAITALTTTTSIFGFTFFGVSVLTPTSGIIYLNLGTASTGTSQTISVDLQGYLI